MGSLLDKFNSLGFEQSKLFPSHMPIREIGFTSTGQRRFEIKRDFENYGLRTFQEEPPPLETLPKDIQDLIERISDLPPLEKIKEVHQATLLQMRYDTKDLVRDRSQGYSIKYVLERGNYGDCDDFSAFETGLLQYAGFEKEDINFVFAAVEYDSDEPVNHTAVMVEIDGEFYYLDMNLKEPVLYDGKNPMNETIAPVRGMDGKILNQDVAGQAVSVEITPAMVINMNRNEPSYFYERTLKGIVGEERFDMITKGKLPPLNQPESQSGLPKQTL